MHPRVFASTHAKKPAMIMAETGDSITYGELEPVANQGAHFIRSLGIQNGDIIALWATNSLKFMEIYWAAQRAGIYICPLPTHLSADDAVYILGNCGAKLLIISSEIKSTAEFIDKGIDQLPNLKNTFSIDGNIDQIEPWSEKIKPMLTTPIDDEEAGFHLIYSSGTTGRPKGVKLPLIGGEVMADTIWADRYEKIYNLTDESVFLACAPLYHSAPILFVANTMRRGATIIIMKKFNDEGALRAIEKHKVTMSQMVPTMFIRMLRLPKETRASYDVSSLEHVIHAAAPCPKDIKYQMMDWFGDIIDEYYAGSESIGATTITSAEWRERPGSVGRGKNCTLHVCDEAGDELPTGETGTIYFAGGYDFEYLGEPEKTKASRNPKNSKLATLGDIGYVDEAGYLFLTDRKNFVIISGGVNIYPQETENLIIQHPKVLDVAVIGVPNAEMGEEMKAVIQPLDWNEAGDAFAEEIIAYCRSKLGPIKCPKSVDFDKKLPRQENGKLFKRIVRKRYWPEN